MKQIVKKIYKRLSARSLLAQKMYMFLCYHREYVRKRMKVEKHASNTVHGIVYLLAP